MVIKNKYLKIHNALIQKRLINPYTERDKEKHHIIPKSLGGTDKSTNLVSLSIREHFIIHKLLCKFIAPEYKAKMNYALWAFVKLNKRRKTIHRARDIEHARLAFKSAHAEYMLRVKDTDEFKQSRRKNAIGKNLLESNKKKSESAKKRIWSDEIKQKMSVARKQLYADPVRRKNAITKCMESKGIRISKSQLKIDKSRQIKLKIFNDRCEYLKLVDLTKWGIWTKISIDWKIKSSAVKKWIRIHKPELLL